jgi:hypothetical protein
MVDATQALNSGLNPANVWRAAHPYDSWPALFTTPGAAESQISVDQPACTHAAAPARATQEAKPTVASPRAPAIAAIPSHNSTTTYAPDAGPAPTPVPAAETVPGLVPAPPKPTAAPLGGRVLAGPAVASLPTEEGGPTLLFPLSALALLLIGVGAVLLRRRSP